MWGYSIAETAVVKLAFSWLASQTDPGLDRTPTSSSQPDPGLPSLSLTTSHPCPVWSGFYQQSLFQLIGKLTAHMLSICFAFPDYRDVPDQITLS